MELLLIFNKTPVGNSITAPYAGTRKITGIMKQILQNAVLAQITCLVISYH